LRYFAVVFLLSLLVAAPLPGHAIYRIGVEQLQPVKPFPGDTVVFKLTLVNEASWSDVIYVEVISPDGIVYPAGTIRYRAGDYIPSTAYVSFEVPEDALAGNYTLSLRSSDHIYNEARFYVFEREVSGFYIDTVFSNGTLRVAVSSPHLIRGLGVELLSQLSREVETDGGMSKTVFLPVDFRAMGQSYYFLGDVREAEVSFHLVPEKGYIVVPVRITWEEGERVVTWSGVARPDLAGGSVPVVEVSMGAGEEGVPMRMEEDERLKKFLLPVALFSLILPSVFVRFSRLKKGIAHMISRFRRKPRIFEGGKKEVADKWYWVEWCIEEIVHSYNSCYIGMDGLRSLLRRRLDSRETSLALAYLFDRGVIYKDKEGGRCKLRRDWRKRLR
jgi:hypothetical protein